jgi:hypothetical protein
MVLVFLSPVRRKRDFGAAAKRRPYVRLIVLGKRAASFKAGSDLGCRSNRRGIDAALMRPLDLNGAM